MKNNKIDLKNMKSEEIIEKAREEGYELSQSELDQIAGGWDESKGSEKGARQCPKCGGWNTIVSYVDASCHPWFECLDCHRDFPG